MTKNLFIRLYNYLFENNSLESKQAGTQHFRDRDYVESLLTFYCPVCDKEVAGNREIVYDRGYDRREVTCLNCQTRFYGERNIIIDDPRLVAQEMESKTIRIGGQNYFRF